MTPRNSSARIIPITVRRQPDPVIPALAADATGPTPALVHCHASDPIVPWTRCVVPTRLPAQRLALLLRTERTAHPEGAVS